MLTIQAAGERQRADNPVSDPLGMRDGGSEVAPRRGDLATMEADHGGDAEIGAGHAGILQVFGQDLHLSHRIVPPPRVEEQLTQGAVRLSQPDPRADPVCEVPRLPGRGEGLLVPVEPAQHNSLVDLQQQPQVGQCRIGLGHRQRPVEQRQRVSHLPLLGGHDGQHVQCPADRPVVTRLRCRHERRGGDPAGLLGLAEVAVHPCGEHEQPGAVPGRDLGGGQSAVQHGQGFRGPAGPHTALRQCPVQVNEEIGLDGLGQCAVRHLLGLGGIADTVERLGESAHETVMLDRASRGIRDGLAEEFCRGPGRLAHQQLCGASQPAQYPLIHRLGRAARSINCPQQLPGHPVSRCVGLSKGAPGIAVPGGAHRRRYLVVQRRTDHRMPEPETVARLSQHADGACLVNGRDQVRHAATEHGRQVRHGEIHAEQCRGPQYLAYRPGNEAKTVRYGRRQGTGCGTARQLDGSRVGNGQAGAASQRSDQLSDVERVARGAVGEPQQAVVRLAAGQGCHQLGHRRLGEPGELEACGIVHHSPQRQQVIPLRHRTHHPDQQQRYLPHQPGQPPPQGNARLICPLEIVDDQDCRQHRALLGDERQQLLRQRS